MDFGFSDTQREIKDTARSFLSERFPAAKVRELAEAQRYDDALWQEMVELGWTGIAVDEDHGGQGLGMVELALLCEELGYACAPTPFMSNTAAALAIAEAGTHAQRAGALPGLAAGTVPGTVGFLEEGTTGSATAELVPDAEAAELIALLGDGSGLIAEAARADVSPLSTIDPTRRFATVAATGGDQLPGDTAAARDLISVAMAAELTGIAQRAMEMAVAYAKEREQFGRPIGAYQAVSNRCARMLYDTEEARSLTYYAAWTADAEPESLANAAAMAKARASEAAWAVTNAALQVHGGIGFTWEHDLHFLLKRARMGAALYGTAGEHRERVATLAGLSA